MDIFIFAVCRTVHPTIFLYFYSKTNQMHNISNLFYFGQHSTCFGGLSLHLQESKTVHIPDAVCTVLDC